jgi:hypothetical protein
MRLPCERKRLIYSASLNAHYLYIKNKFFPNVRFGAIKYLRTFAASKNNAIFENAGWISQRIIKFIEFANLFL